jgi:hypothetical protein
LAFSGGGIRSATFCFGLARALAKNGVWRDFDYLSTVSGGGYIGTALGRLYSQAAIAPQVEEGLACDNSLLLWWLRRNGRFLLPAGMRDAMRAAAGYMRGFVATQIEAGVLCIIVSCAIILPHLLMASFQSTRSLGATFIDPWWALLPLTAFSLLSVMYAYWFVRGPGDYAGTLRDFVWCLALLIPPSAIALVALPATGDAWNGVPILGWFTAAAGDQGSPRLSPGFAAGWLALVSFSTSGGVGWLLHLVIRVADSALSVRTVQLRLTAWLAFLLVLSGLALAVGLLDLLSWIAAANLSQGRTAPLIGSAAVIALLAGIGRSLVPRVERVRKAHGTDGGVEGAAHYVGLAFAAGVLGVWLLLVQWLVFFAHRPPVLASFGDVVFSRDLTFLHWLIDAPAGRWLGLTAFFGIYVLCTGRDVQQLNLSSLHWFYRSRLARAYVSLGNSPDRGGPNANVRFSISPLAHATSAATNAVGKVSEYIDGDDSSLGDYRPHEHGGPIHLINACVNQTIDDRTDMYNADRKGVLLAVSALGAELGTHWPLPDQALAKTDVSQWVAVSGAAVGSGMGSMTRPGTAALSFLTGVRLGYWWDRPHRPCPFAKYAAALQECFGRFPGLQQAVLYVSDGGHFDNTGVYSLLKRAPELIVAADCGADPGYLFADLENLVRKARIDYDCVIEFLDPTTFASGVIPLPALALFGTPDSITADPGSAFLVVGRITYQDERLGTLLVVKPRRIRQLSMDVAGYSDRDRAFPQQTTGDQFFDEAQWESYCQLGRALGEPLTQSLLAKLPIIARDAQPALTTTATSVIAKEAEAERGSRRQRFAMTVGKTLSIGAALSVLAAAWQIWGDARGTMESARKDEIRIVAGLIRGEADAPGHVAALFRDRGDTTAEGNALESIIAELESLGALHGWSAEESARETVVQAIAERCVRLVNDEENLSTAADQGHCAKWLAVLTWHPRGRWSTMVDDYWDPSLVYPVFRSGEVCAPIGVGRPYLVFKGPASRAGTFGMVRELATTLGLRTKDDVTVASAAAVERLSFATPTLLAPLRDNRCLVELEIAFRRAGLPVDVQQLPGFSYSVGEMHLWLPEAGASSPAVQSAGIRAKQRPMVDTPIDSKAALTATGPGARPIPAETRTVYVQFHGSATRAQINDFRTALANLGNKGNVPDLRVPAAERRPEEFTNVVKYFHEDKDTKDVAETVATETRRFFEGIRCKLDPPVVSKFVGGFDVPKQIEVWVRPACKTADLILFDDRYVKAGYWTRVDLQLRLYVDEILDDAAVIRVTDESGATIPSGTRLTLGKPVTFASGSRIYTLTLTKIGRAGLNPLNKAAFFKATARDES